MKADPRDRLPDNELLGQMSYVPAVSLVLVSIVLMTRAHATRTLIFAAQDTTSTALSITLTQLSERPDAQEKLRAEILEAMSGEDLDYDKLVSLPYLDAVCRETLRL